MNQYSKNKIIIAIIIILILVSGLYYFWRTKTKQITTGQTSENPSDSFPLGDIGGNGTGNTQFSSSTQNGSNQSAMGDDAGMPTLRQISDKPVAGGIAFKNGSSTIIRYVERGTGHIVETTDNSFEFVKISNTTIPKVPQVTWSPNGQSVVMRYMKEGTEIISSFSANIVKATTSQDVSKNPKSAFLPSDITQLSINPTGDKIFYLINNENGAEGVISNTDGSQKKQIFKSPATEWLTSWPNKETIVLTTKPSSNVAGYLFFLNQKTGESNKILSGINGLTALVSSTTKNILYSESADNSIKLKYYNLKTGDTGTFSFKTLPEKCVWSKVEEFIIYCAVPKTMSGSEYPDSWYQGLARFNDGIWKINVKNKLSELILDLQKENGNEFDITEPFLSDNDEYLFFINKKDLTLWSLSLKKPRREQADF